MSVDSIGDWSGLRTAPAAARPTNLGIYRSATLWLFHNIVRQQRVGAYMILSLCETRPVQM